MLDYKIHRATVNLLYCQNLRSLLVLDDVWDQDVIGAFEVCSTVVVTTRDKGLHSCALGEIRGIYTYSMMLYVYIYFGKLMKILKFLRRHFKATLPFLWP